MASKEHAYAYIQELEPGLVEFQTPTDAESAYLMVTNDKGQVTAWGASPTPGARGKSRIGGFLKKSWGYCQLTFWIGNDEFHSEKIHVGWNKLTDEKDLEWQKHDAKYRELITYCRQRTHVHNNMAEKARLHMRPVGEKAHNEVVEMFDQIKAVLNDALYEKVVVESGLDEKLEQAKEKENWANGQDGVYPDPPEQKWYWDDMGRPILKAHAQQGFDRRPHRLCITGDKASLFYQESGTQDQVQYCLKKDWNDVVRGRRAWQWLPGLNAERLGRDISKTMIYLKVGNAICSFFVPRLDPESSVSDHTELIAKVRKWKHSPRLAGWFHRHRWNRVLILLGETEDVTDDNGMTPSSMPMEEIERLSKKPWGYRWKEVLKTLRQK